MIIPLLSGGFTGSVLGARSGMQYISGKNLPANIRKTQYVSNFYFIVKQCNT